MPVSMACKHCIHRCLCTHSSLILSSDGASFYKFMTGNFSSQLDIPAEFAGRMNLRVCKDVILMGPSGHLWHLKLSCTNVSPSFRDGWQGFVSDNGIKARDILVFKHARNKYFVVQVFGAIQQEHEQNDKMCDPKEEILSVICSQKSCEINEIDSEDSSTSTSTSGEIPNVGSSGKKVQRNEGKSCYSNLFPPQSLFLKDDAEEVLGVPNPVKSPEPMFSLTLTKSATSMRFNLTIPHEFGDRWLQNNRGQLIFQHHKNPGEWRHMLGIYRCRRQYGVRWKGFVIDNNLQKGDKCVFRLINVVKRIFKIYVNR